MARSSRSSAHRRTARAPSVAPSPSAWVCTACEARLRRAHNRCPECFAFRTVVAVEPVKRTGPPTRVVEPEPHPSRPPPEPLAGVPLDALPRRPSGLAELDRVLGQGPRGHGLVAGQVVVLGGEPGVGKSTLLLQALAGLTASGDGSASRALYATGEESRAQVASRARRLGLGGALERIDVVDTYQLETVDGALRSGRYTAAVLDSLQTFRVADVDADAGSVRAVKIVAERLTHLAKETGVVLWLVGQATKDGRLAGPMAAAHFVDTVVWFERDPSGAYRVLHGLKNRFGPEQEVAMFEMGEEGLVEVADPSARIVGARLGERPPGSVWTVVAEQDRPLIAEVQAFETAEPSGSSGRRVASGVDAGRLTLLLGILERRVGVTLAGDVFVDLDAGVRVTERALDLPLALALGSAAHDASLPPGLVAFGKIALTGELRAVPRAAARVAEARRLGFTRALVPAEQADRIEVDGVEVIGAWTLSDAFAACVRGPHATM